jgi:hypothetical protein
VEDICAMLIQKLAIARTIPFRSGQLISEIAVFFMRELLFRIIAD